MTKTYTKYIGKNTSDSHQISPHWVCTFTRFNTRDTYNYDVLGGPSLEPVRKPLVVENDCISVSVNVSKTNPTPNATITLSSGDLNYATAISPGDFVLINMVNFTSKAREIRDRAILEKPINRVGDGFKGVFKINSVNKVVNVDPASGVKTVRYQVTAYGFTEWNNIIYYNPTLGDSINKDVLTYAINEKLLSVLNSKLEIQKVLEILPNIILGNGRINATDSKVMSTKKEPYIIPGSVFKLMGMKGKNAVDLYRVMLGIWGNPITSSSKQRDGFNPKFTERGGVQSMDKPLQGMIPIQTSPLTNVRLIDLLKRYSNELINETYLCYRIDKNGYVLPKVIIRQKPFNTEHGKLDGTRFLKLPRWKISSDLIYSLNVSKNESLRFNFVHIIGTTGNPAVDGANLANQNSNQGTIKYDNKDIERHGLRPYTQVSNFDWPRDNTASMAPYWASLCFDWVYGGHLKTNGKISCVGIEDDICIGDNLELQDTVYHIEAINHIGTISPDGRKIFRTNITLSHGVDKRSSSAGPVYPEMDYTDTKLDRDHDYENEYGIMPGFSDTQDIRGRNNGEEVKETSNKSYTPLNLRKKTKNDGDN